MMDHKLSCAIALIGLAMTSRAANASDGTITFTGMITSQTCSINGTAADGARNISVSLPRATQTSLTALNSTAGDTAFTISLTGCTPEEGRVHTRFEPGATVHAASGELITSGAGASSSLRIQLLNGNGTVINVGAPDATQGSVAQNIPVGGAVTLNYIARYKRAATTPVLGAGAIAATVTYSLIYN